MGNARLEQNKNKWQEFSLGLSGLRHKKSSQTRHLYFDTVNEDRIAARAGWQAPVGIVINAGVVADGLRPSAGHSGAAKSDVSDLGQL